MSFEIYVCFVDVKYKMRITYVYQPKLEKLIQLAYEALTHSAL